MFCTPHEFLQRSVSEMSWVKKVRKPRDLVKPGETVEVVILGVNAGEQRMSLGLKQALV